MFILLIGLEVIGVCTIVAELFLGIAVTGWQGEKPYVVRTEQPGLFSITIGIQLMLLIFPWVLYVSF